MFIILLRFSDNKAEASQYMQQHNAWLQQGFDNGMFQISGGLQSKEGGAIVAHGCTLEALQGFVERDPFVQKNIVSPEIIEISATKASQELAFLLK